MSNIVFIATSLDGYISDKDDGLDWLHSIPNPEKLDLGFGPLMNRIDAIVMGRKTFEKVHGFDGLWIAHGVVARGNGDLGQLLTGSSIFVHVTTRRHGIVGHQGHTGE